VNGILKARFIPMTGLRNGDEILIPINQ
jgi:hypothetical protein